MITYYMRLTRLKNVPLLMDLPLILVANDEECIVTCEQIPQIYGSGNTPAESLDMFCNKMLSIRNNLRLNARNLTPELISLSWFLDKLIPKQILTGYD